MDICQGRIASFILVDDEKHNYKSARGKQKQIAESAEIKGENSGLPKVGKWVRAPNIKEIKDLNFSILSRLYCKLPIILALSIVMLGLCP